MRTVSWMFCNRATVYSSCQNRDHKQEKDNDYDSFSLLSSALFRHNDNEPAT